MFLKLIGRVLDKNESNGMSYVNFLDVETGGQVKLTIPGENLVEIDQKLNLDCEVKPGIGKFGMYLKVVKINKEGGK